MNMSDKASHNYISYNDELKTHTYRRLMTQRSGSKKSANCRLENQSNDNKKQLNSLTGFCTNTYTVLNILLHNT